MRRTLLYALLLSVPPGVAAGSGVSLLAGEPTLGLLWGVGVAAALFALVVLGSEYGSPDETRTTGP